MKTIIALNQQGKARARTSNQRSLPAIAVAEKEYVDPFLFETGYFESREEYEKLSRTAKIRKRLNA
ncbi:MAG: hypothetical protein M3Y54_20695 [Bacteroidota bacterium]|nr:hypothetical protein [Bacteroidota bacterium]